MALIGKIRGMRMRDGKSISEISRLTSLSRNTIKKWLNVPQGGDAALPAPRRVDQASALHCHAHTGTGGRRALRQARAAKRSAHCTSNSRARATTVAAPG